MATRPTIKSGAQRSFRRRVGQHARRKFFQAVELNPKDQDALRLVAQMDELFAIEAQARKEELSPQDRQLLRLDKSQPLLEQIKSQIQRARSEALPKSVL